MSDATAEDLIRQVAYTADTTTGLRRRTPEGLYGRRKMTAYLRRLGHQVSAGAVDRGMRTLGLQGVRRGSRVFTTVSDKTASRAPDLVERNFTAAAPNELWVTDFTYCRTWTGFVYVAFIVDVYAQLIVSWHASTRKTVDLVEVPLRIAIWERHRQGRPIVPGRLVKHSDAGRGGRSDRPPGAHPASGAARIAGRAGSARPRNRHDAAARPSPAAASARDPAQSHPKMVGSP